MPQEIKKAIANVTINYEDGTKEKLEYYALVGLGGDTWYKIMLSPPKKAVKIAMNNYLAELSGHLIASIEKEE